MFSRKKTPTHCCEDVLISLFHIIFLMLVLYLLHTISYYENNSTKLNVEKIKMIFLSKLSENKTSCSNLLSVKLKGLK